MRASDLHVVYAHFNPARWARLPQQRAAFEAAMLDSGVSLTSVEVSYGERPWELEDSAHVNRIRLRGRSILFIKECALNAAVARLPEARYFCFADGDIEFRKPSWAMDALHALQQHDVIQPWSDAYDLGPKDEHVQAHKSFCRVWWQDQPVVPSGARFWKSDGGPYDYAHSGFAWCWTRQALEWVGGLIDTGVLGHGDHHMALALVGLAEKSFDGRATEGYRRPVLEWQARALRHVNRNLGFVWGTIEHSHHGPKSARGYVSRWDIAAKHRFDPASDLKRNSCGLWELAGNKPELAHAMERYFHSRLEDANVI